MSQKNAAFNKLLEFEKRATGFTAGTGVGIREKGDWSGVVFAIGDQRLTCSLERVHEFLPPPPVTRVPGTKSWILGLANVRGDLVTVIDLSHYLGGERTNITVRSRLLAASLRGRPVGLLVDEVFGQQSFTNDDELGAKAQEGSPFDGYITRQFRADDEIWQELDLDALCGAPEFLNGAAA
jgi:twitching motility protein PilI